MISSLNNFININPTTTTESKVGRCIGPSIMSKGRFQCTQITKEKELPRINSKTEISINFVQLNFPFLKMTNATQAIPNSIVIEPKYRFSIIKSLNEIGSSFSILKLFFHLFRIVSIMPCAISELFSKTDNPMSTRRIDWKSPRMLSWNGFSFHYSLLPFCSWNGYIRNREEVPHREQSSR